MNWRLKVIGVRDVAARLLSVPGAARRISVRNPGYRHDAWRVEILEMDVQGPGAGMIQTG